MENKIYYKRFLIILLIIIVSFTAIFTVINITEYRSYRKSFNTKTSAIIETVKDKYPNITDEEILEILNSQSAQNNPFKAYSYDIENDEFIHNMKSNSLKFITIEIATFILMVFLLFLIFILYNRKKDKEIKKITKIIENINRKNYELEIEDYTEDELSILKSEIYKTTLMLKETAENSLEDKVNLKNSLSDISHQLKTPLTSILIMLENIIDDENMDKEVRNSFIKDIKREILNINFLVQSILKLSKFESNTINFLLEEVEIKELIDRSVKNISSLCDLKNIKIEVKNSTTSSIKCDSTWQVEAITNILKNAVEHSDNDSKVLITTSENNVYKEIQIQDFGTGIDKEDLEHIFERFYKSKNSNKDSIGIGLELSKKIIESANGRINIVSEENKGTTFIIKYYI